MSEPHQLRQIKRLRDSFDNASPGSVTVEERYGEGQWFLVSGDKELAKVSELHDARRLAATINAGRGALIDCEKLLIMRVAIAP